jgi:Xaa-Pro aminopeptidase
MICPLKSLQSLFPEFGLDGLMVPRADAYLGEFVAPWDERLRWVSGFRGSAGLAIVTRDDAALFVDGRYTLQARHEAIGFSIHADQWDVISAWIQKHMDVGWVLGFDAWLHSVQQIQHWQSKLEALSIHLHPLDHNPIDSIWMDRPIPVHHPLRWHSLDYSGESACKKIHTLQTEMIQSQQDTLVLCSPESISWALNIRSCDVPHTPVVQGFGILHADGPIQLFTDTTKVEQLHSEYEDPSLECVASALSAFTEALTHLQGVVAFDPKTTPFRVLECLKQATIVQQVDPILLMRARKNSVEQAGAVRAHQRDGEAVTAFLDWIQRHYIGQTELQAAESMLRFRQQQPLFQSESFTTISAMSPNSAVIHYHATSTSNRALTEGLFLIDSGAQYLDGTTDITRTLLLGDPQHIEPNRLELYRDCYTRILQGLVDLSQAIFPQGTTGGQLDSWARRYLWEVGLDYPHGTGHGVGSYLSVHEGPHHLSRHSSIPLEEGMIVSNEPGYYEANHYGIRLENLMIVRASSRSNFLMFETLTRVPFDESLILDARLTASQRKWLQDYQALSRRSASRALLMP